MSKRTQQCSTAIQMQGKDSNSNLLSTQHNVEQVTTTPAVAEQAAKQQQAVASAQAGSSTNLCQQVQATCFSPSTRVENNCPARVPATTVHLQSMLVTRPRQQASSGRVTSACPPPTASILQPHTPTCPAVPACPGCPGLCHQLPLTAAFWGCCCREMVLQTAALTGIYCQALCWHLLQRDWPWLSPPCCCWTCWRSSHRLEPSR